MVCSQILLSLFHVKFEYILIQLTLAVCALKLNIKLWIFNFKNQQNPGKESGCSSECFFFISE